MKILALFLGALAAGVIGRKFDGDQLNDTATVFDDFKGIVNDALKAITPSTVSNTSVVPVDITEPEINTPENEPPIWGTKYDTLILASAAKAGVNPGLLYRLLNQESRFRDDIIDGRTRSKSGAMGIAQFMPATAIEWLGTTKNALDPNKAIPGAARYLAWLIRQFDGNIEMAVAAYNWGIGNVKRKGMSKAPTETLTYVQTVFYGA